MVGALDAPPPPVVYDKEPPAHAYAATDIRPVTQREKDLCAKADHHDWLYIGGTAALTAATITVDNLYFGGTKEPALRLIGSSTIGIAWGAFVGGTYLSLPKCDPLYVHHAPPEGEVRGEWAVTAGLATLSMLTAPFVIALFQGVRQTDDPRPVYERSLNVLIPAGLAFGATWLPHLIPPRTWSASQELQNIRLNVTTQGGQLGYGFLF